MDLFLSCQRDDEKAAMFANSANAQNIFLSSSSAGLGLSFTTTPCQEQAHLDTLAPVTSQNFLHSYYGTTSSGMPSLQSHDPTWQGALSMSTMTDQLAWAPSVYHTPVLGSPALSKAQEVNTLETVPGLYTSPGSTIASTRCDTPGSVTSADESYHPTGLTMAQCAANDTFQWYTPAQSPADLVMMPYRPLDPPNYAPTIPEMPSINMMDMTATMSIKTEDADKCLLQALPSQQSHSDSYTESSASMPNQELSRSVDFAPVPRVKIEERIASMEEKTKLKRQRNRSASSSKHRPQCTQCHKDFSRKHNLSQHLATSCPMSKRKRNKPCVCPYDGCSYPFDRRHDLERHINSKHEKDREESKHACDVCGQKFPRKDTLRRHWKNKCMLKTRGTESKPEKKPARQTSQVGSSYQPQIRELRPSTARRTTT